MHFVHTTRIARTHVVGGDVNWLIGRLNRRSVHSDDDISVYCGNGWECTAFACNDRKKSIDAGGRRDHRASRTEEVGRNASVELLGQRELPDSYLRMRRSSRFQPGIVITCVIILHAEMTKAKWRFG